MRYKKMNQSRRFSLSFLIMREISSGDISRIKKQTPQGLLLLYSHSVSSVCSDSYKIDILPLCAEFRFVLGQKGAGFFGVAADFRMPRRMCAAETAGFRQQMPRLRCRAAVQITCHLNDRIAALLDFL